MMSATQDQVPAAETKTCARCGGPRSATAVLGLCPKCILDEALKPPSSQLERSFGEEGRRFGDYELGRQIGRGGMGVVYEATQLSLRRPVALKMILDSQLAEPNARRRFTIEAEAVAKLDHPNIVPVYEVGEHNQQPFLSMKLVQGESLRKKIANGELCAKETSDGSSGSRHKQTTIVRLLASIAQAVHHAHRNGVLHRDLKPANILVDQEGKPHLTDFGLAKLLDAPPIDSPAGPLTDSGATLGTPSYMSPEQAGGRRLSPASDVYSLGAILFEMLTGEPPLKAETLLETLRLVAEQQPRRPRTINSRVSQDLDTICMKCLEKNPDLRYGSAEALADDLERWLRQEPIHARPASLWMRSSRWVKRNHTGTALIVSLFVGLSAALVLLRANLKREQQEKVHKEILTQKYEAEVERLWGDASRTNLHFSPAELATIGNYDFRDPGANPIRLTFALVASDDPIGQAKRYALLLQRAGEKMEKILRRPVVFSLSIYKLTGSDAQRPVAAGNVDFQRLGPLTYVQARQIISGLDPLVEEINLNEGLNSKEAVIFARTDAGITNLSQVAGHRVAFAHTNAIISFMAKVLFARAGVTARTLKAHENFDELATPVAAAGQLDARGSKITGFYSHRLIIEKVLTKEFDVGEAQRRHFEDHKDKGVGLKELQSLSIPPDVYVAAPGVDAGVREAFRKSLTSLHGRRDKEILARLQKVNVQGFAPVTDSHFDELRGYLTNEYRWFETGRPEAKQVR